MQRIVIVPMLLAAVIVSGQNSSNDDVDRSLDHIGRRRNTLQDDISESIGWDQTNTSDRESDDVVDVTPSTWTWQPEVIAAGCNYWSTSATDADSANFFYSSSADNNDDSSSSDSPSFVPGLDGDVVGTSDVIVVTHYGRVRGRRVDGIAEAGQYRVIYKFIFLIQ